MYLYAFLMYFMRFWCILFICVFDLFYTFLMHLSSFVRADRVPAALRRPQEKHDPDFLSSLCALPRACGASETSKKRHSWIFRRVSVIKTPNLSAGGGLPSPQSLIPEQCMHLSSTMHAPTESLFPHRVRGSTFAMLIPPTNQEKSRFSNGFGHNSSLVT